MYFPLRQRSPCGSCFAAIIDASSKQADLISGTLSCSLYAFFAEVTDANDDSMEPMQTKNARHDGRTSTNAGIQTESVMQNRDKEDHWFQRRRWCDLFLCKALQSTYAPFIDRVWTLTWS